MIDLYTLPLNVTEHIIKFRDFLNRSWTSLDALMSHHDWDDDGNFISDWLQCNWEMLVERELLGNGNLFLNPFSVTSSSKRVIKINNKPTHAIVGKARANFEIYDLRVKKKLILEGLPQLFSFRTLKEGGFGVYPPFDVALLIEGKQLFTFFLKDLEFFLCKIEDHLNAKT